jgi:cell division protein FtsX
VKNVPISHKTGLPPARNSFGFTARGWMNWAAVSTVTVLLFLFGMSLQASWKLEGLLNQFGSPVEVSVYLDPVHLWNRLYL